jgi:hypothetical protein
LVTITVGCWHALQQQIHIHIKITNPIIDPIIALTLNVVLESDDPEELDEHEQSQYTYELYWLQVVSTTLEFKQQTSHDDIQSLHE